MLKHVNWDQMPAETLNPLLERRFVSTPNVTVARFVLKRGCVVPEHHHHNEQVTTVLEGALKFGIDGREVVVRGGESLFIPPHMPHAAEALEDTFVFDLFIPERADWAQQDDAYLRGGTAAASGD